MGKMWITVGDITLPFDQAVAINRLLKLHGPDSCWHMNDCGCCVTVHPDGDHHRGYVVDSDGGFEYHDLQDPA